LSWFRPVIAVPALAAASADHRLSEFCHHSESQGSGRQRRVANSIQFSFSAWVNTAGEEGRTLSIRPDEASS